MIVEKNKIKKLTGDNKTTRSSLQHLIMLNYNRQLQLSLRLMKINWIVYKFSHGATLIWKTKHLNFFPFILTLLVLRTPS